MADRRIPNVTLEDVKIKFRNFAGKEDQFNREGQQNFTIELPLEVAEDMANDGWNIKVLKAREDVDGEVDTPILNVAVNFDGPRPPQVTMISGNRRTNLTKDTVEALDWADITNVDLIISPSSWSFNGKSGVKAYLEKAFITIEEDDLERKYAHLESGDDA